MGLVMGIKKGQREMYWHFHKKLIAKRKAICYYIYISHQLTSCSSNIQLPLPSNYLFLFH